MFHLRVTFKDPASGLLQTKVIKRDSDEWEKYLPKLLDKNDLSVTGEIVPSSVPLGNESKGKVYHYRQGAKGSTYTDRTIYYERSDNGSLRFRDFKPFTVAGYTIDCEHGEDCDYLNVDLGKQKWAPTDAKEIGTLRWLLQSLQKFNNDIQEEANSFEDEADEQVADEEMIQRLVDKNNNNRTDN